MNPHCVLDSFLTPHNSFVLLNNKENEVWRGSMATHRASIPRGDASSGGGVTLLEWLASIPAAV